MNDPYFLFTSRYQTIRSVGEMDRTHSSSNTKIPADQFHVTVRFRDSRIAYGTSRYCHATVDNEFMNNLSPINRLILYGTTTNLRGRTPRSSGSRNSSLNNSAFAPTSNVPLVRRRGKQQAGAISGDEEQAVHQLDETGESQESKKRKRKDEGKASMTLNDFACDEISIQYKKNKISKNSSEETDEDSTSFKLTGNTSDTFLKRNMNDVSSLSHSVSSKDPEVSSSKSTSQTRVSKPSTTKNKQQQQQWERMVQQLDPAEIPVKNSIDFLVRLNAQQNQVAPVGQAVNTSRASGNEKILSLLELRPIGCHAGHVKFFRPLELEPPLEASTIRNENDSVLFQEPLTARDNINVRSRSNSVVSAVTDTVYSTSNNINNSSYNPSRSETPANTYKKGRSRSNSLAISIYSTSSTNNNNNNTGKLLFNEEAARQYFQHRQFFSERNNPLYAIGKLTPLEERALELEREYWQNNLLLNRETAILRQQLQETHNIYDMQLLSSIQKLKEKEKNIWKSLVSASQKQ